MKKGRKYVFSTLTKKHFYFYFSVSAFLFFFNFAKGTTVSRVRFTPFPSSRSSLEGARSRGARCSQKKRKKKKKVEKKRKKLDFLRRTNEGSVEGKNPNDRRTQQCVPENVLKGMESKKKNTA